MKLPEDFLSSIQSLPGINSQLLIDALSDDAPVSIRLNPHKVERNRLEMNRSERRVPWSNCGFYFSERPAFTFDPLFHSGYYYVQEASSMFVEYVVQQLIKEPSVCLDLCGAPGGKSIGLLSALPKGSLLVSNELIRQRANILSETIIKYGLSDNVVTNNHPGDFDAFPELFDLVLVDAPCSGEGMFRKDENAVKEWTSQGVAMCAARQKDILADVWPALKPGGIVIYSTCTFNRTENEENALWIARNLGASFIEISVDESWGISPSVDHDAVCYRFMPHKTNGEGLFVSLLRKNASEQSHPTAQAIYKQVTAPKRDKKSKHPAAAAPIKFDGCAEWIQQPELFRFIEKEHKIIALPELHANTMLALSEQLKVLSMGIEVAEKKGTNLIPSHSLAMSCSLNRDAFNSYEVPYEVAVSFLRKEAITLHDAPMGINLLTYLNEPLGFVKNVGNRANNLYPSEWRIRSGYLPEIKPMIFSLSVDDGLINAK